MRTDEFVVSVAEKQAARRYQRFIGVNLWQKLLLVLLTVAITVTTTQTNVYAATCAPVFWYYHGDHLGSSNVMTDRSGALVDRYEYYAFGKEKYNDPTCSFNVANRYTGQILDDDTGLYYYGSRYYDPELGRFVQPDSIVPSAGDPQTLNRYSYVTNNPLKYTDPTGHENFFSGLLKALTGQFRSSQGITSGVLGILSGSAGLSGLAATDNYIFGQIFGQNAALYHSAIGSIVMGAASVVAGAFRVAYGDAVGGGLQIAGGVASIIQGAAVLAGDYELAETVGWVSVGIAVASLAYSYYSAYQVESTSGDSLQNSDPSDRGLPQELGTASITHEMVASPELRKAIENGMTIPTGKDEFERAAYIVQHEDGRYGLTRPRTGTLQNSAPSKTISHPGLPALPKGWKVVGLIHTHGIAGSISPADAKSPLNRLGSHYVLDYRGTTFKIVPEKFGYFRFVEKNYFRFK